MVSCSASSDASFSARLNADGSKGSHRFQPDLTTQEPVHQIDLRTRHHGAFEAGIGRRYADSDLPP